jgi:hypothetical protein
MPTEQESASLAVLKGVSIFLGLSEQEFALLTSHLVQRKYAFGELIWRKGFLFSPAMCASSRVRLVGASSAFDRRARQLNC